MSWYKKAQTKPNFDIDSLSDEERNEIQNEKISYDLYAMEPDRCDGCGGDCNCDNEYLSQCVERVITKFPRLRIWDSEIIDEIMGW